MGGNTSIQDVMWECLWVVCFCVYVRVCVCVLTSCPEACDPDVRLCALRTRQEHTVCCVRLRSIPLVNIQPHVVSVSVFFPTPALALCTLWYLSSVRLIVEQESVMAFYVCVCEAACMSALSTSFHCLYTFGRRNISAQRFLSHGMHVQVIAGRITTKNVIFLGCWRKRDGACFERPETTLE